MRRTRDFELKAEYHVPPDIGGSGDYHGPVDGHVAYKQRRLVQYSASTAYSPDWQDMHYGDIRDLGSYVKNGDYSPSVAESAPYVDPSYYRINVRIVPTDSMQYTYGR